MKCNENEMKIIMIMIMNGNEMIMKVMKMKW